jgi:hypothetical protein
VGARSVTSRGTSLHVGVLSCPASCSIGYATWSWAEIWPLSTHSSRVRFDFGLCLASLTRSLPTQEEKRSSEGKRGLDCPSLSKRERGGDVFLLHFIGSVMIVMGVGSVWLIYPFADDDKAFGWRLWDSLGNGKFAPRVFYLLYEFSRYGV